MKSTIAPLLVVLGLGAPLALADVVYRSTMPDGTIIYSDLPNPGARYVRKVHPGPVSTGTVVVTPAEQVRVRSLPPPADGGVAVVPQPTRQALPELVPGRQSPRVLPQPAHQ